jgi:uncharacterized membrane protein (UPF0127 family)
MRHLLVVTAVAFAIHCAPPAQDDSTSAAPATGDVADAAADGTTATGVPTPQGVPAPKGVHAPLRMQPTPDASPSADAPGPAPGCPPDPGRDQDVPVVDVAFPDADAVVHAWLVTTQQDQERGLMYRTSMLADDGMLFDMHATGNYEFWMENTCIPLDLTFASADGTILGIVENAAPLETTPLGVDRPSRYVLEVNAGWTQRHGVRAGQVMTVPAKL